MKRSKRVTVNGNGAGKFRTTKCVAPKRKWRGSEPAHRMTGKCIGKLKEGRKRETKIANNRERRTVVSDAILASGFVVLTKCFTSPESKEAETEAKGTEKQSVDG